MNKSKSKSKSRNKNTNSGVEYTLGSGVGMNSGGASKNAYTSCNKESNSTK